MTDTPPTRTFTVDWKYGHETMEGRPARIFDSNASGGRGKPLIVGVGGQHGVRGLVKRYLADGSFRASGPSRWDLRNAQPPKPRWWEFWR